MDSLLSEPAGKPKNTGMGSLSLLQGIFPTQESNGGLLHCRWILYQLSYQESLGIQHEFLIVKCKIFQVWEDNIRKDHTDIGIRGDF